jgi:hypothetical protein
MLVPEPAVIVLGETLTVDRDALTLPAVAVAVKVAVPTPDTTALTVLVPTDEPSVQRVLALPSASVVVFCGVTLPPPAPITQVTARPTTALP